MNTRNAIEAVFFKIIPAEAAFGRWHSFSWQSKMEQKGYNAMKKMLGLLLLLFIWLLLPAALAQNLPADAAQAFSDPRWSGYQIVAASGFTGDEQTSAQYAVLLKKADHNVLCILEKGTGKPSYNITMETDKAVYQGDLLPRLFMDTGGNALFYSYHYDSGGTESENYSVLKGDSQWGPVEVLISSREKDGLHNETMITPNRGVLEYRASCADNCGNSLNPEEIRTLPALREEMYQLGNFDIHALPKTYEAALQVYRGLPYADTLLYSKEQVITRGTSPLMFEVWGIKDDETEHNRVDLVRIISSGDIRQEIPVGLESWLLAEGGILFEDANFDGNMDFLICRSSGAYNLYYDYWLWDVTNLRYAESAEFSKLEAYPSFDPNTKQIHCFAKDGAAQYYEYDYQVDESGFPHLTAMRDIQYDGPNKRTITLWQPVDGKMTMIKKWTE